MQENGFHLPLMALKCVELSYDTIEDYKSYVVREDLDDVLRVLGPNQTILSSPILFSDKDKDKGRFVFFEKDMFGFSETLNIKYGGEKECLEFLDRNIEKIYRISYSTTINPFFGGKIRAGNVLGWLENRLSSI